MTEADPSAILARAGLWTEELRQRGQVDDAAAERLNETLAESLGERLDRQDDPLLVVMLCGPTAVGKSSLINALARADISRPGLGATTRAAVLYVHEQDDPARLFEYSHLLGGSEQHETTLVRHRRDELLHKVLVDTPDIDSIRLEHKALTARLVHAADLVLFVTSPEKYKVMRSARWIIEQRQQRAMAFLLNKWDRAALGLQSGRRQEVAEDFRNVLAHEGFSDPLIFKVSAEPEAGDGPASADFENEMPALRAWLEAGIRQSTATVIRQRRLRAAWGRLAAAIEPVVPRPLSSHPLLPVMIERLARQGSTVQHTVSGEAALLESVDLEDSAWPDTPGLLGMWTRTRHRLASTAASLRMGLPRLSLTPRNRILEGDPYHHPTPDHGFGGKTAAMLSEAVAQLLREASAARLALGPIGAAWLAETGQLERQLALLPLDVGAELVTQANRRTLRRVAGLTSVYAMEALIALVLLVACGRVGIDFVEGNYAPAGLFVTVLELVAILVVIGNIIATLFFPPLRQRMRRMIAQRARSSVAAVVRRMQILLSEHVEAVDRLAREGHELLLLIDRMVIGLATETRNEDDVDRLFGQRQPEVPLIRQATEVPPVAERAFEDPARRRPSFD